MRDTVTTANITGNPMRIWRVVRRRMERALRRPGVTFGQEVARSNRFRRWRPWRRNYNHLWRQIADEYGKATYGGPREVPVSVPAGREVLHHDSQLMHGGKPHVSPARFATLVRTVVDGFVVSYIDCHTVSKQRRGVPWARWRIRNGQVYLDHLEGMVQDELNAGADAVVYGGDMNQRRRRIRKLHPRQQVLVSSGLDHLWVTTAEDVDAEVIDRHKIGRTRLMDHPILSATYTLTRK